MTRILVIDDDLDVVEACRVVLEAEGYEVAEAGSKPEGEAKITEVNPDLIILDVMMEQPDDGIALAQKLRREGNTTPILMLTSVGKVTGMSYDKDESVVPVNAFCEKPIEPAALIEQVAELLK